MSSCGTAGTTLNCPLGRSRDLEITLPGRAFRRIDLSGSSKLTMENVNQPELAFNISGSGTVRAQGTVDQRRSTSPARATRGWPISR